jgi:type I restriction enzyme S subunit
MSDWTSECLNQLVAFQKGRKVETSPFQTQGFEPYLGAGALSGRYDGYASTFLAVTANKQDVLMLWDGERSGLVGYNLSGVVSSTVCKLTPNEKIDNELLYYLLLFNFDWIQNRRTGTGVPHVPKDIGRILKLDYPTDIYL